MKLQAAFQHCKGCSKARVGPLFRGSEASVEGGAVKDFLQRTAAWAWCSTELCRVFAVVVSFRQQSHRTFTPIYRTRTARSTAPEASGVRRCASNFLPCHPRPLGAACFGNAPWSEGLSSCPALGKVSRGCSSSKIRESFKVQMTLSL